MNLVSPQQLAAMAEAKEVNTTVLRDEVAKIAYTAMVQELGTNARGLKGDVVHAVAKTVAKVSFDFADAFMRERYERTCVKASMQSPSIPDHLGQLNL